MLLQVWILRNDQRLLWPWRYCHTPLGLRNVIKRSYSRVLRIMVNAQSMRWYVFACPHTSASKDLLRRVTLSLY